MTAPHQAPSESAPGDDEPYGVVYGAPAGTAGSPRRGPGRRRFGRRQKAVAGAVVVAWVGAGIGLGLTRGGHPHQGALLSRPGVVPGAPSGLPAVRVPAGSAAVDFGLLRVYLPQSWLSKESCGGAGVDNPANGWCLDTPSGGFMSVEPYTETVTPAEGWTSAVINGVQTYEISTADLAAAPETFFLPPVHLQVTVQGPAKAVMRTVSPSALQAVLDEKAPVVVPHNWPTRSFDGVSVQVPSTWPVHQLRPTSTPPGACSSTLFTTPAVYVGPTDPAKCPQGEEVHPTPATDGVWLGSAGADTTVGAEQEMTLPFFGSAEKLYYNPDNPTPSVTVEVATSSGPVDVLIGLGADPMTAEAIISSLRYSPPPGAGH